jgi:signal peptidase I
MGRHKEIDCPQCGYRYAVNASESMGSTPVLAGTCVNCRYTAEIADQPNYKGDRILVLKTLFDLPEKIGGGPPKRWDVTVFKYPEEPETNYIKRLVGLPNEDLRIERGDIRTRPLGTQQPFVVQRKGLDHQRAMQILVNDDAHVPKALADDARWRHWRADDGGWKVIDTGTYGAETTGTDWLDMRYEHRVPTPDQWRALARGAALPGSPKPTLITDYYAYNTFQFDDDGTDKTAWFQPHWVGDLTVEFVLQVDKPTGEFRAELVEAGVPNRFVVDLATGMSRLERDGKTLEQAQTPIREGGRYRIRFANVDDRLTVWVNHLLPFGDGIEYTPEAREPRGPQATDLKPIGLAVTNGSVSVSRLKVSRDIYYTLHPSGFDYGENLWNTPILSSADLFDLLSDPKRFEAFAEVRHEDFPIGPGRYMMMGDNSPLSKDSRAWTNADRKDPNQPGYGWDDSNRQRWEVPERLIVGKAFMVYWPHAQPFWPRVRLNPDLIVPFRPYFERMKVIR